MALIRVILASAFLLCGVALSAEAQDQATISACEGGDTEACLEGTRQAQAVGDIPLMLIFIRQGCALENIISCSDLGMVYLTGTGVDKDIARAKPYILDGCDKGYGRACANLGWMYFTGTGFAQNSRKAATYYAKGCEGRSGAACANLGLMYANGDGVPQSDTEADRHFDRACDLGHVSAC